MSQSGSLYHLQTLDSELEAVRTRLAEVAALLQDDRAVQTAQAALDDARNRQRQWQTRVNEMEHERASLRDEAAAAEERLYSGRVHNPRELTELQDKVRELTQRRDALEEPLLEAMLASDQAEADCAAAEARLSAAKKEHQQAAGDLAAEERGLSARQAQLEADIAHSRQTIDAQYLSLYDQLRRRPGRVAVTPVIRDECGVCHVRLTSQQAQQIHRGEVLTCPTCGRILVFR